jgi:hypothetical protein
VPETPVAELPHLDLVETDRELTCLGAGFGLVFSRNEGTITSLRYKDTELLTRGPLPHFWRAPTDNDEAARRPHAAARQWREAGLDRLRHHVRRVEASQLAPQVGQVRVESFVCAPDRDAGFHCETEYTIYGSGDIQVDAHVYPDEGLPALPRIGMQMRLPRAFDHFAWYGRGPHETYADRKEGAQVGVYDGGVQGQFEPYITPQENGNKTETRWAALTRTDGVGLLAVGMPYLNVSAHHYSTEDLTRATHTYELEQQAYITLNLDHAQSGLGGASCGPGTREPYLVLPQETHYAFRLKPVTLGPASLMGLARQRPEKPS